MGSPRAGRHRLGQPGLRYCRELPEVSARLEQLRLRQAETARPRFRPAYTLGALAATGAVVVSGWLVAGSTAFADIIGR